MDAVTFSSDSWLPDQVTEAMEAIVNRADDDVMAQWPDLEDTAFVAHVRRMLGGVVCMI